MVEGPGKRGEVVQICADPACEVHGKPDRRAEQEAAVQARQEEWKRRELQAEKNRTNNRRLLDRVLHNAPVTLTRDDYRVLVIAGIDRLDFEDSEALTERHGIRTDETSEPDAAGFELRKRAEKATEAQLIRMLFEIALLKSGYSDEELAPTDPLVTMAARYAKKPRAAGCVRNPARRSTPKGQPPKATQKRGAA